MRIATVIAFLLFCSLNARADYDLCVQGATDVLVASEPTDRLGLALKAALLERIDRLNEARDLYDHMAHEYPELSTPGQAEEWSREQLYLALKKCYLDK